MIVMTPGNPLAHYWAGRYGGVGVLISPSKTGSAKEKPTPWMPYALDNRAFAAWKNGEPWVEETFVKHGSKFAGYAIKPLFVAAPDVVTNCALTLEQWPKWHRIIKLTWGLPVALCLQDGMSWDDVDALAERPDWLFLGGSTGFKWTTLSYWGDGCKSRGLPWHVGRVNTGNQLPLCKAAGAWSVDGTGWWRGKEEQVVALGLYLRDLAGHPDTDEQVIHVARYSRTHNLWQPSLIVEEPRQEPAAQLPFS